VAHGQRQIASLPDQVRRAVDGTAPLLLPGVYDALSARLAAAAGFEAIYVTGAGLANSRLGVPDIGLTSVDQLADHVGAISDAVDVPLVVDGDTGFGNAINVAHTVRKLERAGASAIQLEDQVFPKKCGHFAGKAIIPLDEMAGKLQSALDARRSDDTLIIARTDARATDGVDAALERAHRFREIGADLIFVEAPTSVDELRLFAEQIDAPLVANMVEGGSTPIVPLEDLGELGYAVVLYANAALRSAQRAVTLAYAELKSSGISTNLLDSMATWEERQNAVGKPEYDELEARYAS
jgi:2-methylisocitrate lyase-like PEP mutase family enzyme